MFNKECSKCTLKHNVFCKERIGSGSRNMVIKNRIEHINSPISLCPVAINLISLPNYLRSLKIRER